MHHRRKFLTAAAANSTLLVAGCTTENGTGQESENDFESEPETSVISVSPGDDLQEKINEAEGGGGLVLEAGTYKLPANGIEIGSHITIEGATGHPDDVVLIGDPDNHSISETNYLNVKKPPEDQITIRGLTVDSGFEYDTRTWNHGISTHLAVISADNTLIENCKFKNGLRDCLDITQSVNLTVRDCVLEDSFTDDVLEINDTSEPTGINTKDGRSDNILIENCEIRRAGYARLLDDAPEHWCNGIEIEGAAEEGEITIKDCTIEESLGLDLDVQSEGGIDPYKITCINNSFNTGANELYESGVFEGTPGKCLYFNDGNTFKDGDIDNVLTGHRTNIRAPAWGIENC